MTTGNQHGDRRGGILAAAAVAAAMAIIGVVVLVFGLRGDQGPSGPPREERLAATTPTPTTGRAPAASTPSENPSASKPDASPGRAGQGAPDFGPVLTASDPVGLDIPATGVRSKDLVGLGLAKDGSIEVPSDYAQPGWYTLGPTPGEFGPAVISGHVDSKRPRRLLSPRHAQNGPDNQSQSQGRFGRDIFDRQGRPLRQGQLSHQLGLRRDPARGDPTGHLQRRV